MDNNIYVECVTSGFFWYEGAVEFTGIVNIKLSEIVKGNKQSS